MNYIQETRLDLPPHVAGGIGRPLLAVLPFKAAGDDPELQQFGTRMADALRERLETEPALRSRLISSEFLAQAPAHAVELICRELRVGYLVTGKCHAGADGPSLYVELTDTREWHIHWAHFCREQADAMLADAGDAMTDLVASLRRRLVEQPAR